MFVVTGATGSTGSRVARGLLDAGAKVRVLVRDAGKAAALAQAGAEVVVGNLDDGAVLAKALAGARGLYLMSPPEPTSTQVLALQARRLEGVVKAARVAGVGHVVLLSSIGAQHAAGTGPIVTLHGAEKLLAAAGLPTTAIRAAYFLENWAAVLPAVRNDGVLPSFIAANQTVPMVSAPDIARAAVKALLAGPQAAGIVELAGADDVSPNQIAASLGQALGRPIKVVEAPLDAVVPTFTSFGFSSDVASLFREMYAGIASGHVAWSRPEAVTRGTVRAEEALRTLLG